MCEGHVVSVPHLLWSRPDGRVEGKEPKAHALLIERQEFECRGVVGPGLVRTCAAVTRGARSSRRAEAAATAASHAALARAVTHAVLIEAMVVLSRRRLHQQPLAALALAKAR